MLYPASLIFSVDAWQARISGKWPRMKGKTQLDGTGIHMQRRGAFFFAIKKSCVIVPEESGPCWLNDSMSRGPSTMRNIGVSLFLLRAIGVLVPSHPYIRGENLLLSPREHLPILR